eukprot:TRINITY_DN15552_c0_g1_i1.p1 TRINITY_DN15552_c0_g1~~TRINITY_DN15552_c0_g1_i1.p1  ORF type:complete len:413 (-),score=67.35 TRINITY_DN15552_c0_g1_i1:22-1260(-)
MISALRTLFLLIQKYLGSFSHSQISHHHLQLSTSPLWILGKSYHLSGINTASSLPQQLDKVLVEFLLAFQSRIWFSYRTNFVPIEPSFYTSDFGWGCMIRSGQMMLAQALQMRWWGNDWTLNDEYPEQYFEILRNFADAPDAPFSVHRVAQLGLLKHNKRIGQWFGPSTIAVALHHLVEIHEDRCGLKIHVCQDGVVYVPQVNSLFRKKTTRARVDEQSSKSREKTTEEERVETEMETFHGAEDWSPTLLIFPLKLGLQQLNPIYLPALLETFSYPQSVGIIGGHKGSGYYFVAVQDQTLFFLDPHFLQPTVDMRPSRFPSQSFHYPTPKSLPARFLDPSLAIGMYCHTREDFEDCCQRIQKSSDVHPDSAVIYVSKDNIEPYTLLPSNVPDITQNFDDNLICVEEETFVRL